MYIDIDNIEFSCKTKYQKEIHFSHVSSDRNYDCDVDIETYLDNIYTVPLHNDFLSFSDELNSDSCREIVALANMLEAEYNPCFYQDPSISIDNLTQEICSLSLPSAKSHFQNNSVDDQIRQINLNFFDQINKISYSKVQSINSLKEIKMVLRDLSEKYFNEFLLAEHYSFKRISDEIEKINLNNVESILDELERFGKLNESILELKKQLATLFSYIENIKSTEISSNLKLEKFKQITSIAEELLEQIEKKRYISKRDYFSDYKDKTLDQSILQTVSSLYIYELNKLKQVLYLMMDNIEEVPFHFNEFNSDLSDVDLITHSASNLRNKKIVIFTCSYGNGHRVTAAGIRQILQKELAHPVVYDLSTGPLLGKDRWRQLFNFFGIYYDNHPLNGVDIFNEILRKKLYFIINTKDAIEAFVRRLLDISGKDGVTPRLGIMKNSWEKTQVRELLFTERPDHIITTYHMDLNPIIEVAEELGIPVLHIPTDYNMKFSEVFDKKAPEYFHFKSLVPNFAVNETLQTKKPLNADQLIEQIGIPLRPEFYRSLNENEILLYRHSRFLANDEKVLFLSTGGNGQNLPHPELLANSPTWDIPLRVLIIVGKNRDFAVQLQRNLKPQNGNPLLLKGKNPLVTIEIVTNPDIMKVGTETEFFVQADELSRLLDISDASIAKAGGISVAELLFKGVPILFDQRVNPFSWEHFNMEVVINRGLGLSNLYIQNLETDLKKILNIPRNRSPYFYFENGRELFLQLVSDQIHQADADVSLIKRRAHLFLPEVKCNYQQKG